MTSTIRSKSNHARSYTTSKRFISIDIHSINKFFIGVSQTPHPFLRMQIFNFQVLFNEHHQYLDLSNVTTQIELKEKHRTTRDHVESNRIIE